MKAVAGYTSARSPRVAIAGNYGFGNIGDEAVLEGVLGTLRARVRQLDIVVVSGDPGATAQLHDVAACSWEAAALADTFEECDAVLLGGGGLLHDYSTTFDPSGIAGGDDGHLARYFRVAAMATALGKPLGLLGLGIGPFRSPESARHTQLAFEQAWAATVRDANSLVELKATGADVSKVVVAPDPAFARPLAPIDAISRTRARYVRSDNSPLVVVAPRPWQFGPPTEQWVDATAGALDGFLADHGGTVVFVAFQAKTSGDRSIGHKIRARMRAADRAHVAESATTVGELAAHIAAADVVVGVRLHSVIFALHHAVPALALSYDPKVAAVMADNGQSDACVELARADRRTIAELLDRAWSDGPDIRAALLAARDSRTQAAREGIDRFAELLTESRVAPSRTARSPEIEALATSVARDRWRSPGRASAAADVICFSIIRWEFRWQRPQQLLALWGRRGRRVFYIRMADFLPAGGQPIAVTRVADNVWEARVSLPAGFSVFSGEHPNGFVEAGLASLRILRERFLIDEAISVVHAAGWAPLAFALRERCGWPVIYDCMDDWGAFPGTGRAALARQEAALVRNADIVTVASRHLQQQWADRRTDTLLLPNAADIEFFESAARHDPLPAVAGPVAGFVGAIAEWFDRTLMTTVAISCPGVTFVLVGGVHRVEVDELANLPNVRFEGPRPYELMPSYIRRFDVCLLPFALGPLTDSVDPVKLHEYLSLGKPVVATRFAEIEHYAELIYIASDASEFTEKLRTALDETDTAQRHRRIAHARSNTWAVRLDQLEQALHDHELTSRRPELSSAPVGEVAALTRRVAELEVELRAAQHEVARLRGSRVWRLAGRYWRTRHRVCAAASRSLAPFRSRLR